MLVARETTGCSSQAMWSIALLNYNRTITLMTHVHSHILNKSVLSPTHIYVESTLGGAQILRLAYGNRRWRETTKADTVFEKLTQKSKRIMWVFKHVLLNKYSHVLDFTPSDIFINMQNFKHTEQLNTFFPFSAIHRKYTKRNIPFLSPANGNWEGVRKTSQT